MDSPFEKEIINKDPDFILDYSLDWSTWLGVETIATSVVTAPAGITLVSQSNTTTLVNFRLSGGSLNNDYEIINSITTAPSGQATQRAVIIHMAPVERPTTIIVATVGGATSNSYITLGDAKTYFSWRLYTDAWDEANDQQREAALLMACQRLEQEDYIGIVVDEDVQALKWPRQLNEDGDLIRTYPITTVPQPIKNAQCEVALWILKTSGVTAGAIESIKIGNSVEIKSASGSGAVVDDVTVDFAGLPMAAAQYLKGLRLHSVLA